MGVSGAKPSSFFFALRSGFWFSITIEVACLTRRGFWRHRARRGFWVLPYPWVGMPAGGDTFFTWQVALGPAYGVAEGV